MYTGLQQTRCISSKGKSTFCTIKNDKECILDDLADFVYDKVEKNQVLKGYRLHNKNYANQKIRNKWT